MRLPPGLSLAAILATAIAPGLAAGADDDDAVPQEPYNTGWSIAIANDGFLSRDEQFTGGGTLELSGRRAVEYFWSLDPVLGFFDRISGFGGLSTESLAASAHSFTASLLVFTPDNLETSEPIRDDHPYGSLFTIGNTRQTRRLDAPVRYRSTFLLGILGTDIGKGAQNLSHELTGSERARGWDNQISDGGEPTFRYMVSRQEVLESGHTSPDRSFDWRYDVGASLGYVTEAAIGTSVRWGRFGSRWWDFDPAFGDYTQFGAPKFSSRAGNPEEWWIWLGVKARVRLYNALLEGQFRDSEVTFDRDELEILNGEIASGITADIPGTNLRGSFELRLRSRELSGSDAQDPIFGVVTISRHF